MTVMCARPDYGVPETIAAADGCECPGRWCERPTPNDIVTAQTGDA